MRHSLIAAFLVVLAPPLAAADAPRVSWGKAGVSYDVYRADARECALSGWNADIEGTEAVRVFRDGTGRIESLIGTTATPSEPDRSGQPDPAVLARQAQIAQIVEGTRPKQRYAEVRGVQIGTVDRCLAGRGYTRFALTDGQRRRLTRIKHGSPDRHRYLFSLASDGAVLAAQPAPDPQPAPVSRR